MFLLSITTRIINNGQVLIKLAPKSANLLAISQRGKRNGVPSVFRTQIPKFKKSTRNLPPLTDLLTAQYNSVDLKEIMDIRARKLEVYKEYLPIGTNTNYIDAIFHPDTNDSLTLLDIIDRNLPTLNSFHIAVTFEALDDLLFAKLCEPKDLIESEVFKNLCLKTLSKIRFFESDEVLKLLKCVSRIGVPEDTLIVQAAFQMARHHINDFNIDELETLHSTLHRFKEIVESSKSLLVALKAVIPKAKELQIKQNLITSRRMELLDAD